MSGSIPILPLLRRRTPRRGGFLLGLLAVLLWAQLLGFMHPIVHIGHDGHAGHSAAPGAALHVHGVEDDHGHVSEVAGWMAALFSGHDDESGCRLYDGVGQQALALPAPAALPCLLPPATRLNLLERDFVARWAALFDARGPPLSR